MPENSTNPIKKKKTSSVKRRVKKSPKVGSVSRRTATRVIRQIKKQKAKA